MEKYEVNHGHFTAVFLLDCFVYTHASLVPSHGSSLPEQPHH
jgi:hypothetical protein